MAVDTLLERITDHANRPDPYPLYAELREAGVVRQTDGSYLVGTYYDIAALLHDPRVSSDPRNLAPPYREVVPEAGQLSFIRLDDPEHHRLRGLAMRPFGPPHSPHRVDAMRGQIASITAELAEALEGRTRIDVVEDFAYPLPVTVICRLLGVPREDEPVFREWSAAIVDVADITPGQDPGERRTAGEQALTEMGRYLVDLAEGRRGHPGDDMLSAFVNEPGGAFTREELAATAVLLLVAGHETTVNLIANGVLTLLRHPDQLDRLRREPDLLPAAVEELLRYEPPVQIRRRTPLANIDVAGVTVPKGVPLILVLASGNRDPKRFPDPERFDPARTDNQHLGFGGGVHLCYGAPLARVEAQTALGALIPHLGAATLLRDPPAYRHNAMLRGPRHLPVEL
ncbi:putative cytochrome P450 [Sphaerisporangium krabiense]|uniref:Cytochrome P450 n=1 Tax=Sphaerisporangium krabiense TaxID=763782 RepID=A0A7W8Z9A9_9ACTN|nr:cytochrome P450 [Sphaerisporangium krabiense]MBB5629715.1 cytochrome P450 [Sphaerisporangium krabiense]GII63815.1 putative cytochrome P450 [Sphaerisporangium krabiense]